MLARLATTPTAIVLVAQAFVLPAAGRESRVALVIGNGAYTDTTQLVNPANGRPLPRQDVGSGEHGEPQRHGDPEEDQDRQIFAQQLVHDPSLTHSYGSIAETAPRGVFDVRPRGPKRWPRRQCCPATYI